MTYAATTDVPVERSRAEVERILQRYGADAFMYGWNESGAVVQFRAHERHVKFVLPLPDRHDRRFTHYKRGRSSFVYERTADAAEKLWEQASRQRWRALTLVIKAKLEAVEAGISVFETEFLGHIVLPSGETVAEWMSPQIAEAYASGMMPEKLTLALPAAGESSAS